MFTADHEFKTLLNVAAATQEQTGTVIDLAPSASVNRRQVKLLVACNGNTYAQATQASWPIIVEECDTTNGTFTAVAGDTISNIGTAEAVVEYSIKPSKRYVRGRIGTVGTGGTSANIMVLLENYKLFG